LIVTSGVESYRQVFGPVLVDDEEAPEQNPLGIERGIVGQVGTDVGRLQLLRDGVQHSNIKGSSNSSVGGPGPFPSPSQSD